MIFSVLLCRFVLFSSCFRGNLFIFLPPADWGPPEHFLQLASLPDAKEVWTLIPGQYYWFMYYCQVSRSNLQTVAVVKGHRRLWPLKHSFIYFLIRSCGL